MNKLSNILADEASYATTLLAILVDTYSLPELVEWEPETLILQVEDDFKIKMPDINRDKVWALITAISTNMFYTSAEMFIHISCALTNDEPSFQTFDPPTPDQMAWAITEVLLNDSDSFKPDPELFSTEVKTFIGVMLDYYNIDNPPDVLAIGMRENLGQAYEELDEDPVMISAKMQRNNDAADDIKETIMTNLKLLINQLHNTPLKNRDEETWNSFYEKASQFLTQL